MQQYLESKLYSDVEGTCSGQFGFIIAVVSISDIGKGMVISGNGQAEFVTRYRAIVFKPFKGEVVDGVVHNVTRVRVLLRSSHVASDPLSTSQMGIFAEVGPLNCFVSQQVRALLPQVLRRILFLPSHPNKFPQLLHPDLKFDPSSNPPSYTSQDQVNLPNTLFSYSFPHLSPTGHRKQHENTHKNHRHPRRRDGDRVYFSFFVLY